MKVLLHYLLCRLQFSDMWLSRLSEAVTLFTYVQEVPGADVCHLTDYVYRGFCPTMETLGHCVQLHNGCLIPYLFKFIRSCSVIWSEIWMLLLDKMQIRMLVFFSGAVVSLCTMQPTQCFNCENQSLIVTDHHNDFKSYAYYFLVSMLLVPSSVTVACFSSETLLWCY